MPFCRPCQPPIQLKKIEVDPAKTAKLCKCFPTCPSRRREWKGVLQKTSAELILERKPKPEEHRTKITVTPEETSETCVTKTLKRSKVVVLCQAPLNLYNDTTYLKSMEIVKRVGAWDLVKKSKHGFCTCVPCCTCRREGYSMADTEKLSVISREMKAFDRRLRTDQVYMPNMYNTMPKLRDVPGCTRL